VSKHGARFQHQGKPAGESGPSARKRASFLDTEGATQRVAPKDHHNSTSVADASGKPAIHRALAAGRRAWTVEVEATTALYRERRACALEARGRALARERRLRWVRDGYVARDERGKARRHEPAETAWHSVRARGKRTLFRRVEECRKEGRKIRLTCRGCSKESSVPIGCAVPLFCAACRSRTAQIVRADFARKRAGLTGAAGRAGLTSRFRRRALGGRFGERLLTLTVPHEGGPEDRLRLVGAAWSRFWRLLSDRLRPGLAALRSGIATHDPVTGEADVRRVKRGKKASRARESGALRPDELSLWDLVSYWWVREWTPGDDGLGHPHLHVWLFSPFVRQELVQELWARSLADILGRECVRTDAGFLVRAENGECCKPIVDVRAAADVEHELVKYLTKEWEIDETGVRRARPEIFGRVYACIDGRRQRQSSAGFARWAVQRISICPCCGFEAAPGRHWARVELEYWGQVESERCAAIATGPPLRPELQQREESEHAAELRRAWWEARDRDWRASLELRIVQARYRELTRTRKVC
jgi:hypothetical protein